MCPAFPPAEHACGIMPQLPRRAQGGGSVKEGYTREGAVNGAGGIRAKYKRWREGGGKKRKEGAAVALTRDREIARPIFCQRERGSWSVSYLRTERQVAYPLSSGAKRAKGKETRSTELVRRVIFKTSPPSSPALSAPAHYFSFPFHRLPHAQNKPTILPVAKSMSTS